MRGKLSSLFTPPFRFVYVCFECKLEVIVLKIDKKLFINYLKRSNA
jgi:hypothetical protein